LTGLDANVLARFLLDDDALQSPKTARFMGSLTVEDPGWVGVATILELVWVLISKNRFDRKTIAKTLEQLLLQEELLIEQESVVQSAIQLFRSGDADFADCLIASSAQAARCTQTVTFDRIAARDAGMELLA
jgi:predicted nucleic-acid-binding protein